MMKFNSFTDAYPQLLQHVFEKPDFESSPRGLKIRESLGISFRINNIRDRIPYIPNREFSISYMIAEFLYYLSGNNSTEWISNYSSFWGNISDDGKTANSAYGARIFKPSDRIASDIAPNWTQWDYVKQELTSDPDSRRAVIHIRSPKDSILAHKDVPCTLTLQFFIRNGKLHQIASMRSSDLILGLAYDVPAFTIFQELLALELGVKCGSYTHMSNSLHIYERHFGMVKNILLNPIMDSNDTLPMPEMPEIPPIHNLMYWESCIRHVSDEHSLCDLIGEYCDEQLKMQNFYWADWIVILMSHKAKQLKLNDLQRKLLDATVFPGYKLFNK